MAPGGERRLPRHKSAIKRARQAEVRRLRNSALKSVMRTATRRFREAILAGNPEEVKLRLQHAISMVDRAASKGAIHRNQANRRKSRLQKVYNEFLRQQVKEQAAG